MLFEPFCLQTQNGYKPFLSALQTWRKKKSDLSFLPDKAYSALAASSAAFFSAASFAFFSASAF